MAIQFVSQLKRFLAIGFGIRGADKCRLFLFFFCSQNVQYTAYELFNSDIDRRNALM